MVLNVAALKIWDDPAAANSAPTRTARRDLRMSLVTQEVRWLMNLRDYRYHVDADMRLPNGHKRGIKMPYSGKIQLHLYTLCVSVFWLMWRESDSQSPKRGVLQRLQSARAQVLPKYKGAVMKKSLLSTTMIAGLLVAGAAQAADMPRPVYKAPPPLAYFSWTGCYIGAQVGWAQITDRQDLSSPTFALTVHDHASGVKGGGHLGCNYQTNQFVFGIEGDFEGTSIDHRFVIGPPFFDTTSTERVRWQGSIRGRLGIAVDHWLFYGTGGLAFASFNDTYCTIRGGTTCAFFDSVSSTRTGGTVGAGIEYAFGNNWSTRIEYRYTRFSNHTNVLNNFLAPPGTSIDHDSENAVRWGLTYRFGGPLVARY
jgi:outer membrane immunogenic protein